MRLSAAALLIAYSLSCALAQGQITARTSPLPGGDSALVAARGSRVYVLDVATDRVLVCDQRGAVLLEFGGIGGGPGQLYQPYGISLTRSRIVVYDRGNARVEFFDYGGAYRGAVPAPSDALGFAASDAGTIYINDPASGYLVTALNQNGRVLRRFGSLLRLSRQWAIGDSQLDRPLARQAGRAWLAVGDNKVYAVSILAPHIMVFSMSGRYLGERRLDGPETSAVRDLVFGVSSEHPLIASGVVDGHQVVFATKGATFNDQLHRLLVPTPFAMLYSVSPDLGSVQSWSISGIPGWQLWRPAASGRKVWFSRLFVPGVLIATLPPSVPQRLGLGKGAGRR